MKILSILSQKGGVGKTTLATCLAVAAEQDGKKTVIFDIDPQATACFWKDIREKEEPAVLSIQAVMPIPIKLPTSNFRISIPSQVYSLFNDIDDFKMTPEKRKKIAIYPDYIIEPTYGDIKQKKDVVLEKALMLSDFSGSMTDFKRVTFEEVLETLDQ